MTDFPTGWTETTLGEIATSVKNGIFVSRPGIEPDGVPILRISAIRSGSLNLNDIRYSGRSTADLSAAGSLLESGDLLFTRYNGNPDFVGACGIVPEDIGPLTYPDKLIRVQVDTDLIDPRFVYFAFQAPSVRAQVRLLARTTAGQAGISGSSLKSVHFPLPPLAGQRRIVAALEGHFERLAVGDVAIERAERRLSYLRRSAYDFLATGEVASTFGDIGRGLRGEDGLANGWRWCRPDELTDGRRADIIIGPFGSNLKVSDYAVQGTPLIFVRNIRAGSFLDAGTKYVSNAKANELAGHLAAFGDVLITKMGDPPGDACVYTGGIPAVITADCIRMRPARIWNSGYLAIAINSSLVRQQIERIARGVAQRKVSLERFREEVRIPVPPVELQGRVVQAADRLLSLIASRESALKATRPQVVALRRAILREAFAGRLVPQDPSDEPASELLARIRAERAAADPQKRAPRQRAGRSSRTTKEPAAPPTRVTGDDYEQGVLPL